MLLPAWARAPRGHPLPRAPGEQVGVAVVVGELAEEGARLQHEGGQHHAGQVHARPQLPQQHPHQALVLLGHRLHLRRHAQLQQRAGVSSALPGERREAQLSPAERGVPTCPPLLWTPGPAPRPPAPQLWPFPSPARPPCLQVRPLWLEDLGLPLIQVAWRRGCWNRSDRPTQGRARGPAGRLWPLGPAAAL